MSFGYSVGDCLAGATLTFQLIQALSGVHCPSQEYRDALIELGHLHQTLVQVDRWILNPMLGPATVNAAAYIVLSSMTLIGDWLAKTQRYRSRLGGTKAGDGELGSWQKMGWVLFRKDELKSLKEDVQSKLSSVQLLLSTAQFCERVPNRVPSLDADSTSLAPPPSYSHTTEDPSSLREPGMQPKSATLVSPIPAAINDSAENESTECESAGDMASSILRPRVLPGYANEIEIPKPQQIRFGTGLFSDITPLRPLDEEACRKRLTSYEAYTIRKIIPRDPKEKSTWAKAVINRESLSQQEIMGAVKKLIQNRRSVSDKKAALMPFQQGQVNKLMDEIVAAETDTNFEWTLAHLDRKEIVNRKFQRETLTIIIYVKRALLENIDPVAIVRASGLQLEKNDGESE